MPTDDDVSELFARLSDEGVPEPSDEEVSAALDLARVVAHGAVRRGAPLVCYAAGLAMTATSEPVDRARRLRELAGRVAELFPADG